MLDESARRLLRRWHHAFNERFERKAGQWLTSILREGFSPVRTRCLKLM